MKVILDDWWASLTVANKEKIAEKARVKMGMYVKKSEYPGCTEWWNRLGEDKKLLIYNHCTSAHGMVQEEWKEGQSMSY